MLYSSFREVLLLLFVRYITVLGDRKLVIQSSSDGSNPSLSITPTSGVRNGFLCSIVALDKPDRVRLTSSGILTTHPGPELLFHRHYRSQGLLFRVECHRDFTARQAVALFLLETVSSTKPRPAPENMKRTSHTSPATAPPSTSQPSRSQTNSRRPSKPTSRERP
jgi:hypothetical protein